MTYTIMERLQARADAFRYKVQFSQRMFEAELGRMLTEEEWERMTARFLDGQPVGLDDIVVTEPEEESK